MSYIKLLRKGLQAALKDPDTYFIGEDIMEPYGGAFKVSKGLSDEFPLQVMAAPMSEQGFTGMGIGMALAGARVIVEIMFGDFITLCMDQMVNHASKFVGLYDRSLHFVLRTPMGGYRGYGATHSQSLEKILIGHPHIWLIAPSVLHDPGLLLERALNIGNPVLFIENKLDYTRHMFENTAEAADCDLDYRSTDFPTVKVSMKDEDEHEYAIITYGGLVYDAIAAQRTLYLEEEISVHVLSPSLVYPLDQELLAEASTYENIVLYEESQCGGSWASEIAASIFEKGYHGSIKRISASLDVIGAAENLENSTLPALKDLINAIKGFEND